MSLRSVRSHQLGVVALETRAVPSATSLPTVQTVIVGDGAAQRSTVTQLKVVFDQDVKLLDNVATAFQLFRNDDHENVTLDLSTDKPNSFRIATLTFFGNSTNGRSLADGRYTLVIRAASITSTNGPFDGNGDGIGQDDFKMIGDPATNKLYRLFGDVDGDGTVSTADFVRLRQSFNGFDPVFDFDGDGFVSVRDFVQFRIRFNGSV